MIIWRVSSLRCALLQRLSIAMADGSLYGIRQPKNKTKDISSSTTLAFSSQLASLISKDKSTPTSAGRSKPSKSKFDIFTAHNKNFKKRAAADLVDDGSLEQIHQTDIGGVDAATLHRSKRRMEEKAKVYAAMKRGDYIRPEDERGLVDFDRKWAESEARGDNDDFANSSGSDYGGDDDNEELVEYEDEFGRQRTGTRADVARIERAKRARDNAAVEEERASARPKMPENLIYGDAIQAAAFNPDDNIAQRMENLAKKRDRSATPPAESHYDATAEVRSKGTGFYGFSKDAEGRRKEMEALEKERLETERNRREREEKKEKRRKEIEERRKLIRQQRGKNQAEKFLNGLELETEPIVQQPP